MTVTINTDASWSWSEERGSYAFWIVSDSGRVCKSGLLREKVKRAEAAEFQCIINAMYVLTKMDWKDITKVIINTDCLNVIHLVEGNKKAIKRYRLSQWGHTFKVQLEDLIAKSDLSATKIEFRHVRAHVSTDSKKQWVNDWCDREAKLELMKFVNSKPKITK